MSSEHSKSPLEMLTVEIRVQIKKDGRRKGLAEAIKEASEKLTGQVSLYRNRSRLVKYKKKGDELILKYQISKKSEPTIEWEQKSPFS